VPGSPVNTRGAAAWALANVYKVPYVFGNDCTNFVSEALNRGGGDPPTFGLSDNNDQYWYFYNQRLPFHSHSWSAAYDLAVHQQLIHSYWIKYWNDAQPGDLIFANWKGAQFSGITHVGIITSMSNGQPVITQHSPSQLHVTLQYWLTHPDADVHGEVHVWIAVPNRG